MTAQQKCCDASLPFEAGPLPFEAGPMCAREPDHPGEHVSASGLWRWPAEQTLSEPEELQPGAPCDRFTVTPCRDRPEIDPEAWCWKCKAPSPAEERKA